MYGRRMKVLLCCIAVLLGLTACQRAEDVVDTTPATITTVALADQPE
jgi:nitrous oxide reductase accessory protein NosL